METECAGVFGGRWGSAVSVAQSVAFRLLDAVVGLCYGSFSAKGRIQTQQETPPKKKRMKFGTPGLGSGGEIPKQIPSQPLIHAAERAKTRWVSRCGYRPRWCPVTNRVFHFAASQHWDKQPGQGSWSLGDPFGFVIPTRGSAAGRAGPQAGRGGGCLLLLTCVARCDPAESP